MSYIKLTSFDSWTAEDPPSPDLLVNTDNILRVGTAAKGISFGMAGLTYKATFLVFAEMGAQCAHVIRVAESHDYIQEVANHGEHRNRHREYIKGFLSDDWGNPIEEETIPFQQ
jgi:hypothetical protein